MKAILRLKRQPCRLVLMLILSGTIAVTMQSATIQSKRHNQSRKRAARPNIVFILADDLGVAELGAYGQQRIKTPRLDRMAAEGMRFTQFYAGSPVCAPSRCTFLTGRHTGHAYVRDNHELGGYRDEEERGQLPLPPNHRTLARWLRERGFVTAMIGKWGLGGPETPGMPLKQGFDYFFGYLDQKQAHNHYPTHLWKNNERFPLSNSFFATSTS